MGWEEIQSNASILQELEMYYIYRRDWDGFPGHNWEGGARETGKWHIKEVGSANII